jgi:hypothetical protein
MCQHWVNGRNWRIEISSLHPARPPQLGDWMACLRISIDGRPALYAAFIEGSPPRVFLLRRAVRFDNCDHNKMRPFPVRFLRVIAKK